MREKILIVEDNPQNMRLMEMTLRGKNYILLKATNGEEALDMARRERPDLIIMDVIMPGEDGFLTPENLKAGQSLADIPVVLFSDLPRRWGETTATREDMLLAEAEVFIDKAKGPLVLIAALREILGPGIDDPCTPPDNRSTRAPGERKP